MTICIAAVCEYKEKDVLVIATDHMIDVGIGQFEHDIKKYKKINVKNIAMLAGSALMFNELVAGISQTKSFSDIKKDIYNNFLKVREEIIDNQLLKKFNLKMDEIKKIVISEIKNPIIAKLIESIAKLKLETSILLVGFEDGKAKISEIQEVGFADFTDIHFHAIGSGQVQAVNTLLFQNQSKKDNLHRTIYNVYKAKRNAEVSSGVGVKTDILVFSEEKCDELSEKDLEILSKIYDDELERGRNSQDLNNLSTFK